MATEKTTESWMAGLEPNLRPIAEGLRQLILDACPELEESIKWGNPVFEKSGKVCYLAATKSYVSLGFFNGAALSDPDGVIEGTGKTIRHIKVRSPGDIQAQRVISWVREAVALN